MSVEQRRAITELFERQCGFVWRSLRRLGVPPQQLEDAVQEVFITAFRRWSTFEGRSTRRTWLYGIARRIAFRYRRAATTRERYFSAADVEPVAPDPMGRAQAAHCLAQLVEGLDPDKRDVFVLREVEGLTGPEVAAALEIPLGTAYSRLRAAWHELGHTASLDEQRVRAGCQALQDPVPSSKARRAMRRAIVAAALPKTAAVVGFGTAAAALAALVIAAPHPGADASPPSIVVAAAPQARPARVPDTVPESVPHPVAEPDIPLQPKPESKPNVRRLAPPLNPVPDSTLVQEVSLISRAKGALRNQDAAEARRLLKDHARRFPHGQLAPDRRALLADL